MPEARYSNAGCLAIDPSLPDVAGAAILGVALSCAPALGPGRVRPPGRPRPFEAERLHEQADEARRRPRPRWATAAGRRGAPRSLGTPPSPTARVFTPSRAATPASSPSRAWTPRASPTWTPPPPAELEPPSLFDELRLSEGRSTTGWPGLTTATCSAPRPPPDRATASSARNAEADRPGQAEECPAGPRCFLEVTGETLLYLRATPRTPTRTSSRLVHWRYFQPAHRPGSTWGSRTRSSGRASTCSTTTATCSRGAGSARWTKSRPAVRDHEPAGQRRRRQLLEVAQPRTRGRAPAWRLKNYEENSGVDSLDYQELRGDAWRSATGSPGDRAHGSRCKLPVPPPRLPGVPGAERASGTIGVAPNSRKPRPVQRHQLNLSAYFQEHQGGRRVPGPPDRRRRRRLQPATCFENDRSYREASALASRAEWWILIRALDAPRPGGAPWPWPATSSSANASGRDTSGNDVPRGGRLRSPPPAAPRRALAATPAHLLRRGRPRSEQLRLHPAAFTDASITVWRSGDASRGLRPLS